MYVIRKNGATSNVLRTTLRSSTTGQGVTGLTISSTGLIISSICDNEASATAYTAAGSTIETITTLGTFATPTATKCRFKEVDSTNHPGLYEFQFADARFAVSSAKTLRITISGVSGLLQKDLIVQLSSVDLDVVPGAAGGLMISGANTGPWSVSGGVTFTNSGGSGLTLSSSGSNGNGLKVAGNGSGDGINAQGGATGNGAEFLGGSTSGDGAIFSASLSGNGIQALGTSSGVGFVATGSGSSPGILSTGGTGDGAGIKCVGSLSAAGFSSNGGATGAGIRAVGGSTSGDGIIVSVTSGHGINLVAAGAGKHGINAIGGGAVTTSPAGVGIKAVGGAATASSGGTAGQGIYTLGGAGAASTNGAASGLRGEGGGTTTVSGGRGFHLVGTGSLADLGAETNGIAANITGNLSGSVGSVTGNVGGNVVGTVASVVGAVGSVTGSVGSVAGTTGTFDALQTALNSVHGAGSWATATGFSTFNPASDTVAHVTLVDTTTTNTDMRGTNSAALAATALSTVQWTNTLATNLGTLAGHDPGATLGTSTLTQAQVTGGAYSVQSASCVLGDARIANLNASVLSRMATYTQPVGFLAATFPSDPADQSLVIAATDALMAAIAALNNLSSAQAQAAAAAALNAYDAPTHAEMTSELGTLQTHGDGAWVTAAGFAMPGSAMTLANGAITEATIATPVEAAGRPTGILGMVRRVFERLAGGNKKTRNRATGGVVLYGADDATPIETLTQSTAGGVGSEVDTQTKGA